MAKKITIEDLAVIVRQGFKESDLRTDKKIDGLALMVQKGFDGVQKQFDGVQKQFDSVQKQFEQVHEEIHETREVLARAIKDLESRFVAATSYHQEQIDHLRNWMEGIEARVSAIENKQLKKK